MFWQVWIPLLLFLGGAGGTCMSHHRSLEDLLEDSWSPATCLHLASSRHHHFIDRYNTCFEGGRIHAWASSSHGPGLEMDGLIVHYAVLKGLARSVLSGARPGGGGEEWGSSSLRHIISGRTKTLSNEDNIFMQYFRKLKLRQKKFMMSNLPTL